MAAVLRCVSDERLLLGRFKVVFFHPLPPCTGLVRRENCGAQTTMNELVQAKTHSRSKSAYLTYLPSPSNIYARKQHVCTHVTPKSVHRQPVLYWTQAWGFQLSSEVHESSQSSSGRYWRKRRHSCVPTHGVLRYHITQNLLWRWPNNKGYTLTKVFWRR